jgi:hypothetical protein
VALSVNPQRRQIIEKPSNISSSNGTTASEEKSNAGLIIEALSGPLCYNDGGSAPLAAYVNDLCPRFRILTFFGSPTLPRHVRARRRLLKVPHLHGVTAILASLFIAISYKQSARIFITFV